MKTLIKALSFILCISFLAVFSGCSGNSDIESAVSSEAPISSESSESVAPSEPVNSQAPVESSETAESSEIPGPTEPVNRSGFVNFDTGKGFVQFNASIPEKYTLVLPYLDLSHEELQKRMLKEQVGNIEVYRGEDLVFWAIFYGKEQFDQSNERRKIVEENPTETHTVETLREETLENGDICIYSKSWYEKSNDPRFPDNLTLYIYSRKFAQSRDCAMICDAVLSEEEAMELFDCLAITFDHDIEIVE